MGGCSNSREAKRLYQTSGMHQKIYPSRPPNFRSRSYIVSLAITLYLLVRNKRTCSMSAYLYVKVGARAHAHIHTIHIYIYVCIYMFTRVSIHIYVYIRHYTANLYRYVHIHVYTAALYTQTCIYIYVYTYTHVRIHVWPYMLLVLQSVANTCSWSLGVEFQTQLGHCTVAVRILHHRGKRGRQPET